MPTHKKGWLTTKQIGTGTRSFMVSNFCRWNLKLRSNGMQPITKAAFEQLQKAGGVSATTTLLTPYQDDTEDFSLELLDYTVSGTPNEELESSSGDEEEDEHSVVGKKGSAKIDFLTQENFKVPFNYPHPYASRSLCGKPH